jgi:TonB family protein
VHAAQPEFPDEARETGHPLERQVAIAVSVSADGRLRAARVVQSSGMAALDIAALLAAERSTYQPRIVHCRAVASPAVYRVTFSGGP